MATRPVRSDLHPRLISISRFSIHLEKVCVWRTLNETRRPTTILPPSPSWLSREACSRGRPTRLVSISAEPRHEGIGGAAWGAAPLEDHALGIDDRGRRDAPAFVAACSRGYCFWGGCGWLCSRGKASGTVRITATKHAVSSVVMPVLPGFLASHPDIRLDMIIDDNLTDIVAERIDAGVGFGDIVEKDMIAVRIGPDIRMAVVGALSYFSPNIQYLKRRAGARRAIVASTTGIIKSRRALRLGLRGG